jgi:hypothetical protein
MVQRMEEMGAIAVEKRVVSHGAEVTPPMASVSTTPRVNPGLRASVRSA